MKKSKTSQIVGIVLNSIFFVLFAYALFFFATSYYYDFEIPMILGVSLWDIYFFIPLFFLAALTCAIKTANFAFIIKYGEKAVNKIITAVLACLWTAVFLATVYIGYHEYANSYDRYYTVFDEISDVSNFCNIEENEDTEYLSDDTYSNHFLNSISLFCNKCIVYSPENGYGDKNRLDIDMLVFVDAPIANKIAFSAIEKQLTNLKYTDDKMTAYGIVNDGNLDYIKGDKVNIAYISKRDNCFVFCWISAENDDFGLDREKTASYLNNLIEDKFSN